MSSYISRELRESVARRAKGLCEYCLVHESDAYFGCEVDHIIGVKHGGPTTMDNLAYACAFCNRQKGSDIGSILWETGEYVRFFNPRVAHWGEHFELFGVIIEPLTPIGQVTARILEFNNSERIQERQALAVLQRYPSPEAREQLEKRG